MHLEDCREFLMNTARRLLAADSPSGFTQQAAAVVEQIAEELGYPVRRTNKGNVILSVRGRERGKTVGLCAHIDTLGLMVRSITADGMLMITKIGGPILPTLDGEYCRIYTRDGRMYTGTILSLSPAAHVFDDVLTRPRDEKNLAVRIDEPVRDKAGVEALGICAGFSGGEIVRLLEERGCETDFVRMASIGAWPPEEVSDAPELKLPGQTMPTVTRWTVRDV